MAQLPEISENSPVEKFKNWLEKRRIRRQDLRENKDNPRYELGPYGALFPGIAIETDRHPSNIGDPNRFYYRPRPKLDAKPDILGIATEFPAASAELHARRLETDYQPDD